MVRAFSLAALLALGACTTPQTDLRDTRTGAVQQCGGNLSSSILLGPAGYWFQRYDDSQCVKRAEAMGLSPVR
jgi:hypothetical protein